MEIILGGVITVVATALLSLMALPAMLGLTGVPMAIGDTSYVRFFIYKLCLFYRIKFGDRKTTITVAIEPLSQVDIILLALQLCMDLI